MSEHSATIAWRRETPDFTLPTFSRDHSVEFGTGQRLDMSSTLALRGNPKRVNPEELLVSAISSCHMMTFLAVAARDGWVVDAYDDHALGYLEKNAEGRTAVTRVTLRPAVRFGGDLKPDAAALTKLHEKAHRGCFIAASVKTEVNVEPVAALATSD
jgi:organic hydroperoxide reductase OsmC/OhrA